jgi:hypothetical protein
MLISPQRANGIWLRHGNGEVTAPPKGKHSLTSYQRRVNLQSTITGRVHGPFRALRRNSL